MRAIYYGLAASFFFAFTFILNRSMDLGGGSWIWSASLRFIFMAPMLLLLVLLRGQLSQSLKHLRQYWRGYLLWSTVGFGLFYAPISLAGAYGEGWLVAGSWQITIIAGSLLAPLFKREISTPDGLKSVRGKIPFKGLRWSLLILLGVGLMQWQHAQALNLQQMLWCVLPVTLAAFMYPLGNRKMMDICQGDVGTLQRVLNMTLASLPFWLLLSYYGWSQTGWPSQMQVNQSLLVALFSGVIATLLFFAATNLVKQDYSKLAAVEATQSGEVLFALLGEMLWLAAALPSGLSLLGIGLVIVGMIVHSIAPFIGQRTALKTPTVPIICRDDPHR
jgi:drug/metabolite transporter (DMT)-like permease